MVCCLADSGLDGIHQRINQQLLLVAASARAEARRQRDEGVAWMAITDHVALSTGRPSAQCIDRRETSRERCNVDGFEEARDVLDVGRVLDDQMRH